MRCYNISVKGFDGEVLEGYTVEDEVKLDEIVFVELGFTNIFGTVTRVEEEYVYYDNVPNILQ